MTAFNPSSTMMRFRRQSIELYERLGVFSRRQRPPASSAEQLAELERTASRARGIGLGAVVISAAEAQVRLPAMTGDRSSAGPRWQDGYLDLHSATHAVAAAAQALGVRIQTARRVTGFRLSGRWR